MTDQMPLYLVRHGETEFNAEGRYQGQSDSDLTEQGVAQAKAVAEMLAQRLGNKPVEVIASPLGRAQSTATILVDQLCNCVSFETDARITEVGMGAWDGLTRSEIQARWPDARHGRSQREWMFHGPEGERLEDVMARISDVLEHLNTRADIARILVTHAVAGRIIRALHSGIPVLEALKSDAPQDAAFDMRSTGEAILLPTLAYQLRIRALL